MTTVRETYTVVITPGPNADSAATRLTDYIVQRWMPSCVVSDVKTRMVGNGLRPYLLALFKRETPTRLRVDTRGRLPTIVEEKC